jgi:hypothetical protein
MAKRNGRQAVLQAISDRLDVSILAATAKAQHQHREINSRCLRWSAYLSRPGSIKLACPMIKIELEPTSQKRVLRGAAIQRRGIPAGSVMREGTWSTVCPRHSRCATLALTDNKETGVERFLCYDVVPDLHRLRSCTHYHDVRETLGGRGESEDDVPNRLIAAKPPMRKMRAIRSAKLVKLCNKGRVQTARRKDEVDKLVYLLFSIKASTYRA